MTKKERLRLERIQKRADVSEHNRNVLGGKWKDRSSAEKKMYPHRVLTKKEYIPVKDQEHQLINTPRKERNLKQQKEYLESNKKKHGLTSRGETELSKVNAAVKAREDQDRELGLRRKVKGLFGDWLSDDNKGKKPKKDIRGLMSGEKIKTKLM